MEPRDVPAAGATPAVPHQVQEVRVDSSGAGEDASSSASAAAPEQSGAGGVPTARTLFAISSSPYSARRDSANLDASIIEVKLSSAVLSGMMLTRRSAAVLNSSLKSAQ